MRDNLDKQVTGAVIELAAKVKAALETSPDNTLVKTEYGSFYVSAVELVYSHGGDTEVLGYLVPDEGEGNTLDFYTPKNFRPEENNQ